MMRMMKVLGNEKIMFTCVYINMYIAFLLSEKKYLDQMQNQGKRRGQYRSSGGDKRRGRRGWTVQGIESMSKSGEGRERTLFSMRSDV